MRNVETLIRLLWNSLTDPELVACVPPKIQIMLTELGNNCRPGDQTKLDHVIYHFAVAVFRDDLRLELLHSPIAESSLPC